MALRPAQTADQKNGLVLVGVGRLGAGARRNARQLARVKSLYDTQAALLNAWLTGTPVVTGEAAWKAKARLAIAAALAVNATSSTAEQAAIKARLFVAS